MENMHYQYATVTEALNELSNKGFTVDFNLESNLSKFNTGEWNKDEFKISGVCRYEGNTDPADESIVYAIESDEGIKGIFVSGYGISAGKNSNHFLEMIIAE